MAKIPRINQGDRPSATYNPTLDTSVANIMGSIGDVAGEALTTVTAEELAERQKLSMALAAKQRIVDESNAGIVELEFEDTNFKTLAQLERDYADTPEVIPEKYTEIMREQASTIRNRKDINDTVKLMAVKSAESTLSSGLRAAYSISSNLQTKQVKGNRVKKDRHLVNSARDLTTPQQLQGLFATIDDDSEFDHLYGKNANKERDEVKLRATKAQLEGLSWKRPDLVLTALKTGSGFYGEYLKEGDFTALRNRALGDMERIGARREVEILTKSGKDFETLRAAAMAGEADSGTTSDLRDGIKAERLEVVTDGTIPDASKERILKELDDRLEFVQTVEELQRRNIHAPLAGDEEMPPELARAREVLIGLQKDKDKTALESLVAYEKLLFRNEKDRKITRGRADTLWREVAAHRPKIEEMAASNTSNFIMRAFDADSPVARGNWALLREIEKDTKGEGITPGLTGRALNLYIEQYTQAIKDGNGKMPTHKEMERFGRRAYYYAIEAAFPEELR